MAIYRLSAGVVQRSKGHSAVAAAAYRAGEDIHDERLGVTHRYERKKDVLKSEIFAPEGTPDWVFDRAKLWNEMEGAERQKNGQPAREVVLSMPRELSDSENWKLVKKFVIDEFVSKGMIADVSYHKPAASDGKSNPHVHILMTMRRVEDGSISTRKERQWNRDFTDGGKSENAKIGGFKNTQGAGDGWVGKDTAGLKGLRARWSEAANTAFVQNGLDISISHLSNIELGKQQEPQPKMGKTWHSVDPRAVVSHKHRDEVRARNAQRLYRAAPATAKRRSQATTIAQNYALDHELLNGLYGGQKIDDPRREWSAERDSLHEQDKGIELGGD